mmetsp:Transcript_42470/g.30641  ORF Transcript_42470/g.30641 Transcript_42470/m.30641 type:complete len:86 (+) Transcript_42470:206-463(+)
MGYANELYTGQTTRGFMREGIGCLRDATNGEEFIYEGAFKDNYPHGFGRVIFSSFRIHGVHFYEGYFKMGKRHGPGLALTLFGAM